MMIKIKTKEPLTTDLIKAIPDKIAEELYLLEDYVDDEYLDAQDFVILILMDGKDKYIMIHGFPGDNPLGVIYDQRDHIIVWVGEGMDESDSDPFYVWYNLITNNGIEYPSIFHTNNGPKLIFISGLSGSGKTTIGKALVKTLNETGDYDHPWLFKDQDDFFVPTKPKIKLSNGKTKSNWDSTESIDWDSLIEWLSNHIDHYNIVLVGFCLRSDLIPYPHDCHIHLTYDKENETRCIESRLKSKSTYLTTPEKIREDQLMVREVIIPFYQETLSKSDVSDMIEIYEGDKRKNINVLLDQIMILL